MSGGTIADAIERQLARAVDRARFDRLMYGVGFVDVTVDTATGEILQVDHVPTPSVASFTVPR